MHCERNSILCTTLSAYPKILNINLFVLDAESVQLRDNVSNTGYITRCAIAAVGIAIQQPLLDIAG